MSNKIMIPQDIVDNWNLVPHENNMYYIYYTFKDPNLRNLDAYRENPQDTFITLRYSRDPEKGIGLISIQLGFDEIRKGELDQYQWCEALKMDLKNKTGL